MKELKEQGNEAAILERINQADLEIASIEFGRRKNSFPVPDGFVELGKQECDSIVIDQKSNEIVLLDHEVSGRVMQLIAKDISSFIDAICVIEEHYEKCEENDDLYDDESFMERSAMTAAKLAGGSRYEDFYRCVFGI